LTTPVDFFAAPGSTHAGAGWFDRPVAAGLSIVILGALAAAIAYTVGLRMWALPFAFSGLLFWAFFLRLGLWRLFLGIVVILAGWLGWTILLFICFVLFKLGGGQGIQESLGAMQTFIESDSPASVTFQLATFIGVWPAVWLALKFLHGQSFGTLFSPEGGIRWGDFGRGIALAAGFWFVSMLIGSAIAGFPERTDLPLTTWATALVPLAVMVFLQASAEEMIFRGYILQQLAARWRSPLIWGLLPALVFGLAHYSSGSKLGVSWEYVAVTLLFGLTAAALVWRTGSLAAAMGLHTGMNVISLSATGLEGVVEGTQLYLYDASGAKALFLADGLSTLVLLLFVLSPLCPFRPRDLTRAMA
jgi:membrane protease YdiL (CAAX protease family)